MKRLCLLIAILSISVSIWGMPPRPGFEGVHDGSLYANVYTEPSVDSDGLQKAPPRQGSTTLTTGAKKILVILVKFPAGDGVSVLDFNNTTYCKEGTLTHDNAYYKKLLETDSSNLTMTQYYRDMSNNQLNLTFEILGPYEAEHGYKYYGENDYAGDDKRVPHLIREILTRGDVRSDIAAAGDVDPCTVIFVHAGPGAEDNPFLFKDFIWSCRSALSRYSGFSPVGPINGKYYDNYTIQPEFVMANNKTEAGIGVFCHEFGHILGLPDLYDTNLFGQKTAGLGNWSLMASGSWGSNGSGADPTPMMNWERATLGWLPEEVVSPSTTSQKITFTNAGVSDKLLRVNLTDNQYLVFEGKKKDISGTGKFVLEDGLLISQIHEGVYKNYMASNTINATVGRVHGVSIVEAESDNYALKGLGTLWKGDENYRSTTTACFRADTKTSVGPMVNGRPVSAKHPLFVIFFKTMITSFAIVGLIAAIYRGRKKLCLVLAGALAMVFFCLACDAGGGGPDPGPSTYDSGPNTNYYENNYNVHSKTGLTGIRIYDIQCNSDGSGSFWIKKGN